MYTVYSCSYKWYRLCHSTYVHTVQVYILLTVYRIQLFIQMVQIVPQYICAYSTGLYIINCISYTAVHTNGTDCATVHMCIQYRFIYYQLYIVYSCSYKWYRLCHSTYVHTVQVYILSTVYRIQLFIQMVQIVPQYICAYSTGLYIINCISYTAVHTNGTDCATVHMCIQYRFIYYQLYIVYSCSYKWYRLCHSTYVHTVQVYILSTVYRIQLFIQMVQIVPQYICAYSTGLYIINCISYTAVHTNGTDCATVHMCIQYRFIYYQLYIVYSCSYKWYRLCHSTYVHTVQVYILLTVYRIQLFIQMVQIVPQYICAYSTGLYIINCISYTAVHTNGTDCATVHMCIQYRFIYYQLYIVYSCSYKWYRLCHSTYVHTVQVYILSTVYRIQLFIQMVQIVPQYICAYSTGLYIINCISYTAVHTNGTDCATVHMCIQYRFIYYQLYIVYSCSYKWYRLCHSTYVHTVQVYILLTVYRIQLFIQMVQIVPQYICAYSTGLYIINCISYTAVHTNGTDCATVHMCIQYRFIYYQLYIVYSCSYKWYRLCHSTYVHTVQVYILSTVYRIQLFIQMVQIVPQYICAYSTGLYIINCISYTAVHTNGTDCATVHMCIQYRFIYYQLYIVYSCSYKWYRLCHSTYVHTVQVYILSTVYRIQLFIQMVQIVPQYICAYSTGLYIINCISYTAVHTNGTDCATVHMCIQYRFIYYQLYIVYSCSYKWYRLCHSTYVHTVQVYILLTVYRIQLFIQMVQIVPQYICAYSTGLYIINCISYTAVHTNGTDCATVHMCIQYRFIYYQLYIVYSCSYKWYRLCHSTYVHTVQVYILSTVYRIQLFIQMVQIVPQYICAYSTGLYIINCISYTAVHTNGTDCATVHMCIQYRFIYYQLYIVYSCSYKWYRLCHSTYVHTVQVYILSTVYRIQLFIQMVQIVPQYICAYSTGLYIINCISYTAVHTNGTDCATVHMCIQYRFIYYQLYIVYSCSYKWYRLCHSTYVHTVQVYILSTVYRIQLFIQMVQIVPQYICAYSTGLYIINCISYTAVHTNGTDCATVHMCIQYRFIYYQLYIVYSCSYKWYRLCHSTYVHTVQVYILSTVYRIQLFIQMVQIVSQYICAYSTGLYIINCISYTAVHTNGTDCATVHMCIQYRFIYYQLYIVYSCSYKWYRLCHSTYVHTV